jgi:hypothetical protein
LKNERSLKIQEILAFLEKEKETNSTQIYSINENIRFFRSISSFTGFLKWYRCFHKHIDGSRITELTDFENKHFTRELHGELIKVERRKYPGLITPLVIAICNQIRSLKKDVLMADIGSGSMELTRQIIARLVRKNNVRKLTIFAYDKSPSAHEKAIENLSSLNEYVEIHVMDTFDNEKLSQILKCSRKNINIILSQENVFNLGRENTKLKFDIIYHSYLKHHLDEFQKKEIDSIVAGISNKTFEYDGFYSPLGMLIQAIYTWKNPILLNGAVFSILRSPALDTLNQIPGPVRIYKIGKNLSWLGTYLRIF